MALRYALSVSLRPASRAAMSCSVAFSVMALICSDFISVLLCGDLVPSLGAGEPKNRECRGTEGNKRRTRQEATGVTRVARRCARGGLTCLVLAGDRPGEGVQRWAHWIGNRCYSIYIC